MIAQTHYFRLGPVGINITFEVVQVLQDYLSLYRETHSAAPLEGALEFAVRRRKRRLWSRREYVISTPTREHVAGTRVRAGLPDLEALINQEVIQHCRQYLQLHACVMARDGQAVLFPADSGTGKSSLAAGLIRRGWDYLSDELALIDRETHRVHPYPKALCIKESGFGLLDGLGLTSSTLKRHLLLGKYPRIYVHPEDLRPGSLGSTCAVRWILFLERDDSAGPGVQPTTTGEAAMRLYGSGLNTLAHQQHGFDIAVELAKQAQCFILRMSDMNSNLDLLDEIVSLDTEQIKLSEYSFVA